MKNSQIALAILAALSASLALADDLKTNSGKEYKNATVSRVEPDGIMIKFSGGLVKIPFADLSEELKQKYHYNPDEAQKFAADNSAQINAHNAVVATTVNAQKIDKDADSLLQQVLIFAIIKPFSYGKDKTTVHLQQFEKYCAGPTANDFKLRKVGDQFTAVIDEPMPQYFEENDVLPVALYRIGHSNDSSRHPLFTTNKEKAIAFVLATQ